MKLPMGFIVAVKPIGEKSVKYEYAGRSEFLSANDEFIGYFGCANDEQPDGSCKYAIIDKITLTDRERLVAFRIFRTFRGLCLLTEINYAV